NSLRRKVIGVTIARLLARQYADAAAHRNAFRSRLDQRFVQEDGRRRSMFKIQVGEVSPLRKRRRQISREASFRQPVAVEKEAFRVIHAWLPWRRRLPRPAV